MTKRSAPQLGQMLYINYSTNPEPCFIQVHLERCQVVAVGPEYFLITPSDDRRESCANYEGLEFNVWNWRAVKDPKRYVLYGSEAEFEAEWSKAGLTLRFSLPPGLASRSEFVMKPQGINS